MVRPGDKIDVSGTIRTIQYIIEQTAYFKNGIIMDINDVTKFNLIFS